jgi:uncharacterized protein (DUF885 family)
MKLFFRLAGLLAGASVSAAAMAAPFDAWADKVANAKMRNNPQQATQKQYFSDSEQDQLDRKLTDNTRAFRAREVATAKAELAELARFDQRKLSSQQRASAATIAWSLHGTVDAFPYADYDFVFNQFGGLHVQLVNFLTQTHPIRNGRDVENYLVRLGAVATKIDNGIAIAKDAAARGILMPTFITQASIGQLDRFLDAQPKDNVFVATLVQRMDALKDVSAEDKAHFVTAATTVVERSVIPAFQRVRTLLQEQLPRTTADAGLWRLPNGDKAYAIMLRQMTSTNYTPEQIHAIGLQEVARIEQQMDGMLTSLGYTGGTIKERFARLEADSQPKEADPRPALLARYDSVLRDAEERAKLLFDIRPKAPVVVQREPLFTEKTAAAHYTPPARDGSRPGTFWAPLPGPQFRINTMRTLVYHEGVPGHHFQIALQQENSALPRFRRDRVFSAGSAFSEGWALYAEQLAAENGWYEGDVKGHLGQLDQELFRARRLVVDTGLHAMKWTRQQAIDYGVPPVEVDRYVANPGQACAYKIGMMRILDLRAKAQRAMGERFSIKEFHNRVLETGSVPLPVLEQVIDEWIAKVN